MAVSAAQTEALAETHLISDEHSPSIVIPWTSRGRFIKHESAG